MSSERDKMLDMITEMNNWNYKKDKIIEDLQSQLDQANEKLNEHNEYFKEFNCKDFKGFQDFISLFMLTPHEKLTLIKELQNQLNQANERLNKKDEEFGRLSCDYKTLLSHYNVLKEKAIVPKFSSGQIVYFANIVEGTVNKFNYMGEDKYNYVVEDKTGEVFIRMKERTFATEQEAQAKLQELRGGE